MMQEPTNLRPTNVSGRGDDTRPLGTIIAELWENTERLARQELRYGLAQVDERVEILKAEVDERVDHIKGDLTRMTIGGAVLYAGLLCFVATVALLLAKDVDPWLAALITGVAMSGAGYALLQRGKTRLVEDVKPNHEHKMMHRHSLKEALK